MSPSAWTTNLSSYNDAAVTAVNWMYMGLFEWTIARRSDTNSMSVVCIVHPDGKVYHDFVYFYTAVRPVFSLESSVSYVSGVGTSSEPIIIK